MIIESGIIIFVGMLLLMIKLPTRVMLKMLGYPLAVDITGSVIAYVLHYGTFTGLMAAAVAGLMLSSFTAIARYSVGYIDKNRYYPGHIWNMAPKLNEAKP